MSTLTLCLIPSLFFGATDDFSARMLIIFLKWWAMWVPEQQSWSCVTPAQQLQ